MKQNTFLEISNIPKKLFKFIYSIDQKKNLKNKVELLTDNKDFVIFIEKNKKKLKKNKLGIIFKFNKKNIFFSSSTIMSVTVSNILGKRLVQNDKGDTMVYVYDRDRNLSINTGGRYHQTREGGSIHTDNVNLSNRWDYLILSCVSKAEVGGETILVNGNDIYKILKKKYRLALKILRKNFYWEKRGISESFYKSPIIEINKNKEPIFRYLRPYMMSAHQKVGTPLKPIQLYALDVLDSLLESPSNQIRFNLVPGDVLLTKDSQVLHGRTSFSDYYNSKEIFSKKNSNFPLKRTMIRAWIKENRSIHR